MGVIKAHQAAGPRLARLLGRDQNRGDLRLRAHGCIGLREVRVAVTGACTNAQSVQQQQGWPLHFIRIHTAHPPLGVEVISEFQEFKVFKE